MRTRSLDSRCKLDDVVAVNPNLRGRGAGYGAHDDTNFDDAAACAAGRAAVARVSVDPADAQASVYTQGLVSLAMIMKTIQAQSQVMTPTSLPSPPYVRLRGRRYY